MRIYNQLIHLLLAVRKTPSSSARKRLFRTDLIKPGPTRETSKRALFQSPAKSTQEQLLQPPKPLFKPEIANRVERSKRALFSPDNGQGSSSSISSQLETLLKRKRNACDDDEVADLASQSSKLFRAAGNGLTPRALKIKSQSFCIGAGSSTAMQPGVVTSLQQQASLGRFSSGLSGSSSCLTSNSSTTTPASNKLLHRAHSEMSATPQSAMTDNQRKVSRQATVYNSDLTNSLLSFCRNCSGPYRRRCRRRKSRQSMRISDSTRRIWREL